MSPGPMTFQPPTLPLWFISVLETSTLFSSPRNKFFLIQYGDERFISRPNAFLARPSILPGALAHSCPSSKLHSASAQEQWLVCLFPRLSALDYSGCLSNSNCCSVSLSPTASQARCHVRCVKLNLSTTLMALNTGDLSRYFLKYQGSTSASPVGPKSLIRLKKKKKKKKKDQQNEERKY